MGNVDLNRKILGKAAEYLAANDVTLLPGKKISVEVRQAPKGNEALVMLSDDAKTNLGAFFVRLPKEK